LRRLLYRPLSTIPDILTSNRDGSTRRLAPELQIIRVTRVAPDDGIARRGSTRHHQRACLPTARNRHEICISQDRRGADHRPLDSRIKHPRCAAVGRVTAQRLIAIFLASPYIARIGVLLCAQEVSAMCGRGRSDLALLSALPDQPTPVKARAFRAPGFAGWRP
jgi:hypothetical protein